jgi:hypothetical protein
MLFPRKAGAATKTYPRNGMKTVAWRAEFGLGNHMGPRHMPPAVPDLEVTDEIEVFYSSEK